MKWIFCASALAALALLCGCCKAPSSLQEDSTAREEIPLEISAQNNTVTVTLEEDAALPYRWNCTWIEGAALSEEGMKSDESWLSGAGGDPEQHCFRFTSESDGQCVAAFALQRVEGGSEIIDHRTFALAWENGVAQGNEAPAEVYEDYWYARIALETASQVLVQQKDEALDVRFENREGFHWELDMEQGELLELENEFPRDAGYATYRFCAKGEGEAVLHGMRVEDATETTVERLSIHLTLGQGGTLMESRITQE